MPEYGVFGKRESRARQHHRSWAQTAALSLSHLRADIQYSSNTMWEGLRKLTELIVVVVTLLAYGCPLQALCMPMGWMNERWRAEEIGLAPIANGYSRRPSSRASWTSSTFKRMKFA